MIGVVADNGDEGALTLSQLTGNRSAGNSQCQINFNDSQVLRAGSRIALNLNVTFRPAFAGSKIVWMAAQTQRGVTSPWRVNGAWQVPP